MEFLLLYLTRVRSTTHAWCAVYCVYEGTVCTPPCCHVPRLDITRETFASSIKHDIFIPLINGYLLCSWFFWFLVDCSVSTVPHIIRTTVPHIHDYPKITHPTNLYANALMREHSQTYARAFTDGSYKRTCWNAVVHEPSLVQQSFETETDRESMKHGFSFKPYKLRTAKNILDGPCSYKHA